MITAVKGCKIIVVAGMIINLANLTDKVLSSFGLV